ncbi:MAG: CDP-alcohol phosphatidyltransferase family protein [Anaerolineae bacterium]|jgi:CDP-diacylglycerol--glycerol-3-phosphate 3-phosphatidyltransferase
MNDPQECGAEQQRRGTLTDWARARAHVVLDPVAHLLGRLGVHPNALTILGFLLQTIVGALFALGRTRWGGALLLVIAPVDALDGAVARAVGKESAFGAFFDSTMDRLSDAVLILGLAWHLLRRAAWLEVALFLVALVAALMVSYTRARAESLGLSCKVGLLTRMERILLIAVLSALRLTTALAWSLAVLSILTFLQRVVHIYMACRRGEG